MNNESMKFDLPVPLESIILVIGVGGGGTNAVNHMFQNTIKNVDFLILNTDQQSIDISPVKNKILLGPRLTEGRGAGTIPSVGYKAAIESRKEIEHVLSKGFKMVFIVAGMGGGTGTGAAPVIAALAKGLNIKVIGVVTTPYSFEGGHRMKQAMEGIDSLIMNVDLLLIIPNDNLIKLYGRLMISSAFKKADEILMLAVKSITDIITTTGYINVDFADVVTVIENSGFGFITTGEASGELRAIDAVKKALTSPLMVRNNINKAKNLLLSIVSGRDSITMNEIGEILSYVQELAHKETNVIWGNTENSDLGNKIQITILGTGLTEKNLIFSSEQFQIDEKIPFELKYHCEKLRGDYKNKKIAFLIMQFNNTRLHNEILNEIKDFLNLHNIVALRADDREYADDLLSNVLTYIYACDFGISVFERITEDDFNPNVSFEVGYMLGLKKDICILKDKTLKNLPSDLAGRLYKEFDIQDIKRTITAVLEKWMTDRDII